MKGGSGIAVAAVGPNRRWRAEEVARRIGLPSDATLPGENLEQSLLAAPLFWLHAV